MVTGGPTVDEGERRVGAEVKKNGDRGQGAVWEGKSEGGGGGGGEKEPDFKYRDRIITMYNRIGGSKYIGRILEQTVWVWPNIGTNCVGVAEYWNKLCGWNQTR